MGPVRPGDAIVMMIVTIVRGCILLTGSCRDLCKGLGWTFWDGSVLFVAGGEFYEIISVRRSKSIENNLLGEDLLYLIFEEEEDEFDGSKAVSKRIRFEPDFLQCSTNEAGEF